ncbi:LysR family transcriptional regulator [Candidatus Pantoea deserta]|uniref:LysR family transcriptional regulator n=2 Tax=Candidatus Pantoea deserta TaxID=1869313 RepID=A0A3N4NM61_9GAMM|nr:LysR family transcriptional regulator [Pantoea deserta]
MKDRNLEISWLKTFVTVAHTGSMTQATELLYRSQSAISMHIKNIEETLGRKVFNRDIRRLSLTPAGKELLHHAQKILGVYSEAMQSLIGSDVRGTLSLGLPDDFVKQYLPGLLRSFSEKYPFIEISLICEPSLSLIPKIESGELDVAVVTRDRPDRGHFLFSEPLVWTGSETCNLLDRSPLPVAMYEYGSEARKKVLQALDALESGYRVVYSSPYIAGQIAAVESGMAVAVLTRCSVPEHLTVLRSSRLPAMPALDVVVFASQQSANKSLASLLVQEVISVMGTTD